MNNGRFYTTTSIALALSPAHSSFGAMTSHFTLELFQVKAGSFGGILTEERTEQTLSIMVVYLSSPFISGYLQERKVLYCKQATKKLESWQQLFQLLGSLLACYHWKSFFATLPFSFHCRLQTRGGGERKLVKVLSRELSYQVSSGYASWRRVAMHASMHPIQVSYISLVV